MTVIPSTGYINSDKLPFNHEEYKDNELISSFKNKLSENIKFIDVTEAFKEKLNLNSFITKQTTTGQVRVHLNVISF